MDRRAADEIIMEYTKKLFGFALSRTRDISQAEELASRITLEVYEVLLRRDDIANLNGYIYRVAENVYAKHVDRQRRDSHLPIDEMRLPSDDDFTERLAQSETYQHLRREIAYLSKTQRSVIVAHYYSRMKLREIASALSLPVGTVKWHLHEARDA